MSDKPRTTYQMLRDIDDAGLDVYEFRLWCHIWRVGVSWESVRTMANKCGMSHGKAAQAKKSLMDRNLLTYEERNGRLGLAAVTCPPDGQIQHFICPPDGQVVHDMDTVVHHMDSTVHHMDAILSKPIEDTLLKGRGKGSAPSPVPPELASWFNEHHIPDPESADDVKLVQSPAARLWLNVTMRWPGWSQLREVVRTLGERPDEPTLREVWRVWQLNNYSTRNLAGMLERYEREAAAGRAGTAAPVVVRQETADDVRARWAGAMGD